MVYMLGVFVLLTYAPIIVALLGNPARPHRRYLSDDRNFDLPFNTDLKKDMMALNQVTSQRFSFASGSWSSWFHSLQSDPSGGHPVAEFVVTNRSKPLRWVHIHKAGGTFMCHMAYIAGETVVQPSDGACNWMGYDQYKDSGKRDELLPCKEQLAYFRQHNYTWGQLEREFAAADRCFDEFDYGVMLREPLSLMTSEMNYHPGCFLFGGPCGGGPVDPTDFLKQFRQQLRRKPLQDEVGDDQFPLWKFFDNVQTRILASALDVPPGGINESHAVAARRALEAFKVIARLEDLPQYGQRMFESLGWNSGMMRHVVEPVNAAPTQPTRTAKFRFDAQDARFLLELNKYDLALWQAYDPMNRA